MHDKTNFLHHVMDYSKCHKKRLQRVNLFKCAEYNVNLVSDHSLRINLMTYSSFKNLCTLGCLGVPVQDSDRKILGSPPPTKH